jgi:hypothetical protein
MYDEDTLTELYESQILCLTEILELEKRIYTNNSIQQMNKFKSLKSKKKVIENFSKTLMRYNFINYYVKIKHQIQKNNEILDIIFDRIIFFNTKTLGSLEILPKELILKIFSYLNFKDIFTFSCISVPALTLVNEYREHKVLKTGNDNDIGYQKYLTNKNYIIDHNKYINMDPLQIQTNVLYLLDPYNYCEVTFNYI